jgi:hypothetical protein
MRRPRRNEPKLSTAELYDIYFSALGTMDRIFEFWLTASFAVVVASHFISSSMSRGLALLMSSAYVLFSAAMAARFLIVSFKMNETQGRLVSIGESYPGELSQFVGILLVSLFAVGSVGVLAFVWRAYRQSSSQKA